MNPIIGFSSAQLHQAPTAAAAPVSKRISRAARSTAPSPAPRWRRSRRRTATGCRASSPSPWTSWPSALGRWGGAWAWGSYGKLTWIYLDGLDGLEFYLAGLEVIVVMNSSLSMRFVVRFELVDCDVACFVQFVHRFGLRSNRMSTGYGWLVMGSCRILTFLNYERSMVFVINKDR